MIKATFTDDELRAVIKASVDCELEIFRSYADYPEHPFRNEIENKMETLCRNVESGNIRSAVYHMGFTFYAKRCIAAAIIILAIAGITMPETVVAAYHKLVEVVETVFEEYTEFRYYGLSQEAEFVAIEVELTSGGWKKVKSKQTKNSLMLLYMDNDNRYCKIYQKIMPEDFDIVSVLNITDGKYEEIKINAEEVKFIYPDTKEEVIQIVWLHKGYYISGQTNMSREELIEFLRKIK